MIDVPHIIITALFSSFSFAQAGQYGALRCHDLVHDYMSRLLDSSRLQQQGCFQR